MELAKYNMNIVALCEITLSESGSLNDLEYSFFWSAKPEGEQRETGVGFDFKKHIVPKLTEMPRPVGDRIITMRLPLSKDNIATIISVYAPTMTNPGGNKEASYNKLASVLNGIPNTEKLLLIGDFNTRIGRDNDKWPLVMGKLGIEKCNANGELLLSLWSELELTVTNTMFKQKDERDTTWVHLRSRHWHMSNFIITRCPVNMDIHSTRAMRGANCWTRCWGQKWLSEYDKSTTGKGQVSRPSTTQQNEVPLARRVLTRRRTVLSSNGRRRKAQHQTRNGQLCSRSYTTQPRHIILASQTENIRNGSTPTIRSNKLYQQKNPSPPHSVANLEQCLQAATKTHPFTEVRLVGTERTGAAESCSQKQYEGFLPWTEGSVGTQEKGTCSQPRYTMTAQRWWWWWLWR